MDDALQTTSEINLTGKVIAGIFLILFTLFPIWLIMAYWPNNIPTSADKVKMKPLYIDQLYHIRLACIPDSVCCIDSTIIKNPSAVIHSITHQDSINKFKIDSLKKLKPDSINKYKIDSLNRLIIDSERTKINPVFKSYDLSKYDLIDLNTLLLILVAAAGFLGNMVHVATSFTTFVGNGQFKRSWLLWYCVKPFTASALALGLYFVFRGGFLNYNADAGSINLYGVLTISVLAGLFTDKATLKLGEVFEVVFGLRKGDNRTDKLVNTDVKILSISPDKLLPAGSNTITINGENLDKAKLTFKINDELIAADKITITPNTITIQYTIPASQAGKTTFKIEVLDEKKKELFTKVFTI